MHPLPPNLTTTSQKAYLLQFLLTNTSCPTIKKKKGILEGKNHRNENAFYGLISRLDTAEEKLN